MGVDWTVDLPALKRVTFCDSDGLYYFGTVVLKSGRFSERVSDRH